MTNDESHEVVARTTLKDVRLTMQTSKPCALSEDIVARVAATLSAAGEA